MASSKILFLSFAFAAIVCLTCIQCSTLTTSGLETVSDDNIVDMIKQNEFVIVLFSKPDCVNCDIFETYLFNLRNDFKDSLGSRVVKAVNSQLVRLYSPTKEPAVVFFRHGIPLLYDGPASEDEIYMRFDENRSPIVKELSDENFEHLTQASTGATTGDWFIMFYNRECIDCQRLTAVWEAAGAALKNRANFARVDKDSVGASTANRFNVRKAPEFIFIRQGNFYRYEVPKYDVKSFVSFATEWYRNAKTEKVSAAASPFDNLVSVTVDFIKEIEAKGVKAALSEYQYTISFIIVGVTVLLVLVMKCCCGTSAPSKDDKKKAAAAAADNDKKKKTK